MAAAVPLMSDVQQASYIDRLLAGTDPSLTSSLPNYNLFSSLAAVGQGVAGKRHSPAAGQLSTQPTSSQTGSSPTTVVAASPCSQLCSEHEIDISEHLARDLETLLHDEGGDF